MTMPNDAVVVLSRALDQAGDVLAAVHPDQLSLPTPCDDWDVARLIAHLVAAPSRFAVMATGGKPDWSVDPPPVEGSWTSEFRTAADDLIHIWHQQGAGAEGGSVDWQTAEFGVHTWDLAQAIGYRYPLDPEVAERGLAFMSAGLTPDNRGAAFGPEIPAPADASAYERLAAFAGRHLEDA